MEQGPVVIVSGGTYGIGRGITLRLAADYRVIAFGVNGRQMGSRAKQGGSATLTELDKLQLTADVVEADVSRAEDVERVVAVAIEQYGRIDGLVNNAAMRPTGTVLDTPEEVWQRTIDVNLKGVFLTTKAVLPHMIRNRGGSIVNIGSGAGRGRPNLAAYAASKGGVFGLSAALAHDHLADHIRVNVVVPGGAVVSGMTEGNDERLNQAAQRAVAGRNVLPQDIAGAVAFLLSDDAAQITGAVLEVGGFGFL